MKKLCFVLFFVSIAFIGVLKAQNNCTAPVEISALPYTATALTTTGTGNDYGPSDACGSDAMACDDYVFSFTPADDMNVRIALSNTAVTSSIPLGVTANIGLFVTEGCPNETGSICVASNDNLQANPDIPQVSLNAGTTYYIIVSSEMYSLFIQDFPTNVTFDISIEQLFDIDAQVLSISPIASGCGLSEIVITASFKNAGTSNISNFHVGYQIGVVSQTESFTNTISPGATTNFTFAVLADVSAIGTHTIKVFVELEGDQNTSNDYKTIQVTNTPVIDVFPSLADFEADNGYFYTGGTNSSWQHGTPDLSNPSLVINQAFSGENIWATNLAGNANTDEASYLISPCYDVSALFTPTIRFQLWAEPGLMAGIGGTATLEASNDGGNTYTITVGTWNASTGGWVQQEFGLAALQGETNVRFRFTFAAGFMASEGIAIDDFIVKDETLKDVGPGALTLPVGACGLGNDEFVKLFFINYGAVEQTNIPVTYSIDGGETWLLVTETIAGPIPPHDSIAFAFNAHANMITPGSYVLIVKTMLNDDESPENDTRTFEIINTMVVDEMPYTQSFETADHGWIGSAGSSWARGIPSDTIVINQAFDGEYVMATNPAGNTNTNEISELISPCFDITGHSAVRLSMKVWFETGAIMPATINLDGSNDGGETWFVIDQAWTGSSAGWLNKSYFITDFAEQNNCKIRIKYNGQMLPAEGIAVDNIKIEPVFAKDVGVSAYVGPVNGCSLNSAEHFAIEVTNYGSNPQSSFNVEYSLDGGSNWISQVFSGIIGAQQVSAITFNQAVNLSAENDYEVIFRTLLIGDENPSNDALNVTVVHSGSILAYPYEEGFEDGDGGWFAYGTNSSFELGNPTAPIINTAGEGDNSWVTNLDGNHSANEVSYLQGPCFDFSSMVNPMIKARINYETSMFMAGFYMEYSLNSGANWDTVPSGGSLGSWYGASLIPGFGSTWSGSSAGWIGVATNIPVLAGQSNVYLRFSFNSGSFSFMPAEGVGIDDIQIFDCTNLPEAYFEYGLNGLTVQFTSEISNADSIAWNFGDNDFLPSTSNQANPSFTYNAQGTYLVTLTAVNQCGSTTAQQYVDVFTGINNNPAHSINMYPNPAETLLSIETGNNVGTLSICNIQGQSLASYDFTGGLKQISLEGFAKGVYLVKIETDGWNIVKSLIIN